MWGRGGIPILDLHPLVPDVLGGIRIPDVRPLDRGCFSHYSRYCRPSHLFFGCFEHHNV